MFQVFPWEKKNNPHHFNADVEKGDLSVTGPEHP